MREPAAPREALDSAQERIQGLTVRIERVQTDLQLVRAALAQAQASRAVLPAAETFVRYGVYALLAGLLGLALWARAVDYALRVTSDTPTFIALVSDMAQRPFAEQSPFLAADVATQHATPYIQALAFVWRFLDGSTNSATTLGGFLALVGIPVFAFTLWCVWLYVRRLAGSTAAWISIPVLLGIFGPPHVIWASDLSLHAALYAGFFPQNVAIGTTLLALLALERRSVASLVLALVLASLTMLIHPFTGVLLCVLATAAGCRRARRERAAVEGSDRSRCRVRPGNAVAGLLSRPGLRRDRLAGLRLHRPLHRGAMRRTGARGDRQVEGSCRHSVPSARAAGDDGRGVPARGRRYCGNGSGRGLGIGARQLAARRIGSARDLLDRRQVAMATPARGGDSGTHRPGAPRPARVHRARRLVRRLLRARNAGCTRSASSGLVPVPTPLPDPTRIGRRDGRRRVSSPENDRDRRCDVRARAEREARDAVRSSADRQLLGPAVAARVESRRPHPGGARPRGQRPRHLLLHPGHDRASRTHGRQRSCELEERARLLRGGLPAPAALLRRRSGLVASGTGDVATRRSLRDRGEETTLEPKSLDDFIWQNARLRTPAQERALSNYFYENNRVGTLVYDSPDYVVYRLEREKLFARNEASP